MYKMSKMAWFSKKENSKNIINKQVSSTRQDLLKLKFAIINNQVFIIQRELTYLIAISDCLWKNNNLELQERQNIAENQQIVYLNFMREYHHSNKKNLFEFNKQTNCDQTLKNGFTMLPQKFSSTTKINEKVARQQQIYISFVSMNFTQSLDKFNLIQNSNKRFIKGVIKISNQQTSVVPNISFMAKNWISANAFLLNLYFINCTIFCFGRNEFKAVIHALNWSNWPFTFLEWRNSSNFFTQHHNNNSIVLRKFYFELTNYNNNPICIIDTHYHKNSVDLLYLHNAFLIAPINLTSDNWKFSYLLPLFVANFFTHYLVFILLLDARRAAETLKFEGTTEKIIALYGMLCIAKLV